MAVSVVVAPDSLDGSPSMKELEVQATPEAVLLLETFLLKGEKEIVSSM